jgi:hypothetical protein
MFSSSNAPTPATSEHLAPTVAEPLAKGFQQDTLNRLINRPHFHGEGLDFLQKQFLSAGTAIFAPLLL